RRVGDELEGELSAHDEGAASWLEVSGIRLRPVGRPRHPIEHALLTLAWERQPLQGTGAVPTGTWLVLSDGPLGDELIERLDATGARCERMRGVDADFGRAL